MSAFKEGLKAFKEGILGNPYPSNTKVHQDYEFGFNKAYFSNQERQLNYERAFNKKNKEQYSN